MCMAGTCVRLTSNSKISTGTPNANQKSKQTSIDHEMSDQEYELDSDHEVSRDHSKLLEAVSKLDKGQRVKKPERSEPSIQVSEFHLVKSGVTDRDAVYLDDLVKSLRSKPHHQQLSQKFKNTRKKSRILPKPLERPQAERLKREIGFENAKKELQKWDAIVTRNRVAPHLSFPLQRPSFKGVTTDEFVKRFRVQSDLEKELAALEPPKPAEEEEKDEFPLTLEEILQRRREAARFRAQQSYREAKAHRQNKIKSKKFHRLQRKTKIKQQIKDFEQLQKTDPEAALEKLEQLDRTRAEERMSLRHKSTGQWAKNKQIRAKYDKESRQVLAQQLSISRELTQKVQKTQDSDEDDVDAEVNVKDKDNPWVNSVKTEAEIDDFISGYRKYWEEKNRAEKEKADNVASEGDQENDVIKIVPADVPKFLNPVEEVVEVVEKRKKSNKLKKGEKNSEKVVLNGKIARKPRKLRAKSTSEWEVELLPSGQLHSTAEPDIEAMFKKIDKKIERKVQNKLKNIKKTLDRLENAEEHVEVNGRDDAADELPDLSFKRTKLRPDLDEVLEETAGGGASGSQASEKSKDFVAGSSTVNGVVERGVKRVAEIDPTKFITVKPKDLKTQLPDDVMGGDEAIDDSEDEEAQHNIISEAFADDDVVDEFRKEKEEEIKKSQPEDIDLRLPGWGSWGGKNVPQSARKKRRFIIKFPKEAPRRDENKGDVIIVEDANDKVKQHLVTELPFPFTSVADYEASIRAPIGRNFVPETAHKRLTQPPVKTKMGQIIEPMDEDVLLKRGIKVRGKLPEADVTKNGGVQASQKPVKRKGNLKKQKSGKQR